MRLRLKAKVESLLTHRLYSLKGGEKVCVCVVILSTKKINK